MWWGIGGGLAILWLVLVTLGVMTLRNGHLALFIIGIFLPFLWVVGALMRPRTQTA